MERKKAAVIMNFSFRGMNCSLQICEVKTIFEKIQEQIPKKFHNVGKKRDKAERLASAFLVDSSLSSAPLSHHAPRHTSALTWDDLRPSSPFHCVPFSVYPALFALP